MTEFELHNEINELARRAAEIVADRILPALVAPKSEPITGPIHSEFRMNHVDEGQHGMAISLWSGDKGDKMVSMVYGIVAIAPETSAVQQNGILNMNVAYGDRSWENRGLGREMTRRITHAAASQGADERLKMDYISTEVLSTSWIGIYKSRGFAFVPQAVNIHKLIREGKTIEQIIAENPVTSYDRYTVKAVADLSSPAKRATFLKLNKKPANLTQG